MYKYKGRAFRVGNKTDPNNYIISEDTLKANLNEMLSYCEWFSFIANSIIDASMYKFNDFSFKMNFFIAINFLGHMNITHLIEPNTNISTTAILTSTSNSISTSTSTSINSSMTTISKRK